MAKGRPALAPPRLMLTQAVASCVSVASSFTACIACGGAKGGEGGAAWRRVAASQRRAETERASDTWREREGSNQSAAFVGACPRLEDLLRGVGAVHLQEDLYLECHATGGQGGKGGQGQSKSGVVCNRACVLAGRTPAVCGGEGGKGGAARTARGRRRPSST